MPPAAQRAAPTRTERERARERASGKPEHRDPKMVGPWRIGRTIGKGSSGRVKIAKHSTTGRYAAVKIVPKHVLLTSRASIAEAGARVSIHKVLFSVR